MRISVVSNSFVFISQTRIKIHERFIEKWQLKRFCTLHNKSTVIKLYQWYLLPIILIQTVYASEKKNYRNYSTSDSAHKSCILCHVYNFVQNDKNITRTGITVKLTTWQASNLTENSNHLKLRQLCNIRCCTFSIKTRQTGNFWFSINLQLCKARHAVLEELKSYTVQVKGATHLLFSDSFTACKFSTIGPTKVNKS